MSKIVVIDAGHGHYTAGKRCLDGTREWDLNSRIACILAELMTESGYRVYRADDVSGKTDVSLWNRVSLSNKVKADLYISIHHNAGLNGKQGGGTVVYYYSNNTDRERQAKALYHSVVNETRLVGNRAQKVVKKAFYVLRRTKAPAFLIENGFMDSVTDMPIIKTEAHAERTAIGIYNFILNEL